MPSLPYCKFHRCSLLNAVGEIMKQKSKSLHCIQLFIGGSKEEEIAGRERDSAWIYLRMRTRLDFFFFWQFPEKGELEFGKRLRETRFPGKEENTRENCALQIFGLKISVNLISAESTNGLEEEEDDDVAENKTIKHPSLMVLLLQRNLNPSPPNLRIFCFSLGNFLKFLIDMLCLFFIF